ncbi:hypothetical protein J4216_04515 [Candidatus Woesearchaeota archaeon]|nr:hypothetical protein [Candidatus Woesearchaeota archaeon]
MNRKLIFYRRDGYGPLKPIKEIEVSIGQAALFPYGKGNSIETEKSLIFGFISEVKPSTRRTRNHKTSQTHTINREGELLVLCPKLTLKSAVEFRGISLPDYSALNKREVGYFTTHIDPDRLFIGSNHEIADRLIQPDLEKYFGIYARDIRNMK